MFNKFFILIIISPLIQSLPVNETLYNILKEKAPYEIIDYDILFPNKEQNKENPESKQTNQQLNSTNNNKDPRKLLDINKALDIIQTVADLIRVATSLKSGELNVGALSSLTYRVAKWNVFKKVPKKYDFREEYKSYSILFWQRECEPASAYAAALATSYRRSKNYEAARHLSGITIMEHYGQCKKINILDAFTFINEYGLLEFPCRDQTYFIDCEYDDCISYDARIQGFYSIKATPYKCNELYGIKGKKNIKKEIVVNGPVVASFKFYEDLLYYKNGYYEHVTGVYIGTHEAVIVGWDDEGWIVQNSFGSFWGENGFFKVKFDNNIEFGEIVYASAGFIYSKIVFFAFLFVLIF
jgi:hypothetical protein